MKQDNFNKIYQVAKKYKNKKNPQIVQIPSNLSISILDVESNKNILEMPSSAFKIFFKILGNVKGCQFQKNEEQSRQYTLFKEEYVNIHNTYAEFEFPVKEINEHYDYENIRRGLDYLEELNKGWYKSIKGNGEEMAIKGGFIHQPIITRGKICFFISGYFMEKILVMEYYNKINYQLPWILSSGKHIMFALWIAQLKKEGTTITFEYFQSKFEYNYTNLKGLTINVLKKVKVLLDQYGPTSYNYSIEQGKINFIPYQVSVKAIEQNKKDDDKEITFTKRDVTRKLSYWKDRYKLSDQSIQNLKKIIKQDSGSFKMFIRAYKSFLAEVRQLKKKNKQVKAVDYKGDQFIHKLQEHIEIEWKKSYFMKIDSMKNAWPRIV
jgi:hypothetical protein